MRVSVFSAKTAISACLVSLMVLAPLSAASAATKPQYLPPIAPRLDPAAFQQQQPAASAPSVARDYNDDNSPPPVQTDSTDERVKNLLRNALQKHQAGDRNGARNTFKQVLSIDPKNSDANFNLGAMAEDEGDLNAAQNYYRMASLAAPNDSDIRDAVASVQQKMRAKDQERQTAMQLQKKNQLKSVAQDAAAAYKAGQYDRAIGLLQQIDAQAPGDANVKYGLGQAYRGKGDMVRARAALQAAASIDPNNQLYRTTLADLDRQQQQVAQRQPAGGPAGMQYDDMPPGAKDYGADNGMPPIASNDAGPAGTIQPFDNAGAGPLYGHANAGRGISIGGFPLGGLGMGMVGGGLGSMMGGGRAYSSGSRGTRLVRGAVTGGLSGAVIGGLTGIGGGSRGIKSGAMRGAAMGALFGLLSGF